MLNMEAADFTFYRDILFAKRNDFLLLLRKVTEILPLAAIFWGFESFFYSKIIVYFFMVWKFKKLKDSETFCSRVHAFVTVMCIF